MIQEPFVKVNTMDFSVLSSPVPDSLNIGLVINSDTGPVGITRVDSQSEFINKYFVTNQLNPTDDITVKHAYKLLQFMPIYVTRAMDNSIFGGITNKGDTIYVDKDYQVMKYYKTLLFQEKKTGVNFEFLVVNGANVSTVNSKCYYMTSSEGIDNILVATLTDRPTSLEFNANDYIFDTVTNNLYKVVSVNTTSNVINVVLSTEKNVTIKYRAAFNVTRDTKCAYPLFSDVFSIGSFVKITSGGSNQYLYVTSKYSSEWTTCELISGSPDLTKLVLGYNNASKTTNNFYSVVDDGTKINVIIDSNTQLLRVGYSLASDPNIVTDVELESVEESGKYSKFYGNGGANLQSGNYLSINGFTYYSESSASSNNFYPFVTVNFGIDNISVGRFLSYIYDYQLSHNVNIEPELLINTPKSSAIPSANKLEIDLSGDFLNNYLFSYEYQYNLSELDTPYLNNYQIENNIISPSTGDPRTDLSTGDIVSLPNGGYYRIIGNGSDPGSYIVESVILQSPSSYSDGKLVVNDELNITGYVVNNDVLYQTTGEYSKYIISIELLSNKKINSGSIKFSYIVPGESDTPTEYKYEIYTGDGQPSSGYEVLPDLFDVSGNNVMHSSGKAFYLMLDQLNVNINTITITESSSSTINYQTILLSSTELVSSSITGPELANDSIKYSFLNNSSIIGNVTYSGLQLRIDDYLFYNVSYNISDPDITPVKLSSAPLSFIQFIRTLRRVVGNYFNCINASNTDEDKYGLTLMTNDSEEFSNIAFSGSINISLSDIIDVNDSGIVTSAKFAIINKGPSKKKFLQFSLTQNTDDPELWELIILRKGESTSYTISFIEDKVDGYGRNVYYTYVNEMDDYIRLIELEGDDPVISGTYVSELFGNEVPIAEPESDDYAAAIGKFNENEGIYYDFLFDAGYSNMVYSKAIFEVCKNIYAEALLTMPQITDYKQLIKYRQDCGIDTEQGWRCVMRGNWINDTTVADFMIRMSPMCAYIEKIVNNKTGMKEFAPVFGAANGAVTYDAGFYISKKSIREELLNNQIPVLVNDKSLNLRYWNLDTTLKVVDSSLADANNCRMINICAHICDNQMKWYIGRFNTDDLRREVTNSLTNLISNRLIKNQQYPLAGLRVICNSSNNPVTVVENRELVVDVAMQFTPGIRYINVFQKVYKLSQNLDEL